MKWLKDDTGDLINLNLIEVITLHTELELLQDGTGEHEKMIYRVLAVNDEGESYCLLSGTEQACRAFIDALDGELNASRTT